MATEKLNQEERLLPPDPKENDGNNLAGDQNSLSYDELQAENEKLKAEKEADKTVINSLKELLAAEQKQSEERLQELLYLKDEKATSFEKKIHEPVKFKYMGTEYTFTSSTPERFNFSGVNKTQAEWVKDKEALGALINGNTSFIKQLKN